MTETLARAACRTNSSRARSVVVATLLAFALAFALAATDARAAFVPTGFSATPASTQAAGHGNLDLRATLDGASGEQTNDDLRTLQLDLPAGQLLNPQAPAASCTDTQLKSDACPAGSLLGTVTVKYRLFGSLKSAAGSVYLLPATADSPLNFGFVVRPSGIQKLFFQSSKVSGMTTVRQGLDADYGLSITIPQIPNLIKDALGLQYPITLYDLTISLNAKAPSGKYFVFNPTRCDAAKARAVLTSAGNKSVELKSSYTPTGCGSVPFDPIVTVAPATSAIRAATGVNAEFVIDTADAAIQRSHLRDISVALPPGTTLNLDTLNPIPPCTDAQLAAAACPAASRIGDANVNVPFLSAALTGGIFLTGTDGGVRFGVVLTGPNGTQAIFRGSGKPTTVNGDSTILTTFTGLPQAPYSRATLNFTSTLVNNPDYGCPNSWSSINSSGYSGSSAAGASLAPLTGCIPNTIITTPVATPTRNTRPSVNFGSDIPGATFMCRLDSGAYEACTSPYTPATALTDGLHRIVVRAFFGGIGDYTPATTSFTVDTKGPVVNWTTPANNAQVVGDSVKFEWTSDDGVQARCALTPAATLTDCTSGKTFTGLAPGTYSAFLSVRDEAGNWSPTFRTITVVDPAPVVKITSPKPGEQMAIDRVNVEFTITSPVGTDVNITVCDVEVKNGTTWERVDGYYGCHSPVSFRELPPNSPMRLTVQGIDEEGRSGTSIVEFTSGQRDPYALNIDDGPNGTSTNDRTPSFDLDKWDDPLYPNVVHQCAFIRPGATTRDWKTCESTPYSSPTPLADGDWLFVTRSVAGNRVSAELTQDFAIGPWKPTYTASVSTSAAGAHPDLDVNIDVPSGQLRKVDMLMPRGLIGSLNSFAECGVTVIPNPRNCPETTKIGSIVTLVKVFGLDIRPLDGSVFLTAPQVAGDAAGIVILVPKPVNGYGDIVIPMRLQLINNAGQMRVFSDTIPTEVERFGEGMYDFTVQNFKMHLNGSAGSPFPLLTNGASCLDGEFSTVIGALDGEAAPAQSVPYKTTACAAAPFAPQFSQTLGNLQASDPSTSRASDVVADLTLPAGSAAPSSFVIREPSLLSPNYSSFGEQRDQCAAGSIFDSDTGPDEVLSFRYSATNCPAPAKIGTMTVRTPLLKDPLVGDVYWVQRSPIPFMGVNLNNDRFNLNLVGTVIVEAGRIKVTFSNIPDVPMTSAKVALNLPDRIGKGGQPISGKLLAIGQSSDPTCIPGSPADTTMKSQSGATINLAQPIPFTDCGAEPE